MSDDVIKDETSADAQDAVKQESAKEPSVEELKQQLAKTNELLEKARKGETYNRNLRMELEKQLSEVEGADYKSQFEATKQELEQLKGLITQRAVDAAIEAAAQEAGAKDLKAVLKLVDRTKIAVKDGVADAESVKAVIKSAQEEFAVLFEPVKTPEVKRPGEVKATDSFKNEMKSAKTLAEVQAVMAKYGIGVTI